MENTKETAKNMEKEKTYTLPTAATYNVKTGEMTLICEDVPESRIREVFGPLKRKAMEAGYIKSKSVNILS